MRFAIPLLIAVTTLAGCSQSSGGAAQPVRPTATIAPFFSGAARPVPTPDIPTPAPRPTTVSQPSGGAPILQATSQLDNFASLVEEVTIYDERLDTNWSNRYSFDQRVDLESLDTASSGFVSLRAVPEAGFGGTMLTVNDDSRKLYPRSDVLGLRFEVSGGQRPLAPHQLLFKLLGSNRYPYFVEGDNSVAYAPGQDTGRMIFEEVGLDRLGLRRELAVGEWAELELWFDTYDQLDYTYITGLVILNDPSYVQPFYIDNVRLLVRRR